MSNGLKALLAKRAGESNSNALQVQTPAEATPRVPDPVPEASEAGAEVPAEKPRPNFLQKVRVPSPEVAPIAESEDDEPDLGSMFNEPAQTMSGFADEIPAREPLPADADRGMKQFVELMDNVYGVLDDSELLGGIIRNIMVELKSNPQYIKMVATEDVRTWVRAMRQTMGLAKIKKQEAKAKRGTGKSKGSKALDSDMENAFAELGINLDNL